MSLEENKNVGTEEKMTIKAVIWDVGDVITREEDKTPADELVAELGVTRERLNYIFFLSPESTRALMGEITASELISYIRDELGLAPGEVPDLRERFFAGHRIDYDLVKFIRSLKHTYKIGVISNAWSDLLQLLERWKITDAFDVVVNSGNEGVMKPDPRIYQIALQHLDVQAEEAIFVDDLIENIEGARKIGIHGIHFKSPDQTIAELKDFLEM